MEEILFKDKKYLTGVLSGFILAAVILIGSNKYKENIQPSEEVLLSEENLLEKAQEFKENILEGESEILNKEDIGGIKSFVMTPETPHSPQLERLALILREAGRMLDRMQRDIDTVIDDSQLADIQKSL